MMSPHGTDRTDAFTETMDKKRLARIAQAAALYGCSDKSIRRRIADGTITGYKFGPRMLLVDLDEIENTFSTIPTA